MTPLEVEIMNFERGDGFCKTRCPKSKSDIGDCFCAHLKWDKLNSTEDSNLKYDLYKNINQLKLELDNSPNTRTHGSKNKRLDKYSKSSEAYKSMTDTIALERLLNDNK